MQPKNMNAIGTGACILYVIIFMPVCSVLWVVHAGATKVTEACEWLGDLMMSGPRLDHRDRI